MDLNKIHCCIFGITSRKVSARIYLKKIVLSFLSLFVKNNSNLLLILDFVDIKCYKKHLFFDLSLLSSSSFYCNPGLSTALILVSKTFVFQVLVLFWKYAWVCVDFCLWLLFALNLHLIFLLNFIRELTVPFSKLYIVKWIKQFSIQISQQ